MTRALHQRGQYRDELEVAQRGVRRPRRLGPQVALIGHSPRSGGRTSWAGSSSASRCDPRRGWHLAYPRRPE